MSRRRTIPTDPNDRLTYAERAIVGIKYAGKRQYGSKHPRDWPDDMRERFEAMKQQAKDARAELAAQFGEAAE